jgi:hypothetical protein
MLAPVFRYDSCVCVTSTAELSLPCCSAGPDGHLRCGNHLLHLQPDAQSFESDLAAKLTHCSMALVVYIAFQVTMEGHHCIQLRYILLVIHHCLSREASFGATHHQLQLHFYNGGMTDASLKLQ